MLTLAAVGCGILWIISHVHPGYVELLEMDDWAVGAIAANGRAAILYVELPEPHVYVFPGSSPRRFGLMFVHRDKALGTVLIGLRICVPTVLFALYPTIAFIRGPLRRRRVRRRERKGLCIQCAYDLTGNVSGVCPECGVPTEDRPGVPRRSDQADAAPQ